MMNPIIVPIHIKISLELNLETKGAVKIKEAKKRSNKLDTDQILTPEQSKYLRQHTVKQFTHKFPLYQGEKHQLHYIRTKLKQEIEKNL